MAKKRSRPGLRYPSFSLGLVVFFGLVMPSGLFPQAQSGPAASGLSGNEVGNIVVGVRAAGGSTLDAMASINLYTQFHQLYSSATAGAGSVRFEGVPLGTYIVEAVLPGYFPAEEQVELMIRNDQQQVLLSMRLLSDPSGQPVKAKPPLLAPKAQKELAQGLEDLRAGRFEAARKHLEIARRLAPQNPDINYLLGVLASKSADAAQATSYWEKAISNFPNHVFSLIALGEAKLSQGDLQSAKDFLKRAVAADPSSWRAHELLAHVALRDGSFADAQLQAEQTLHIGKDQANGVRLVLAKALIAQSKCAEATRVLEAFLDANPTEPGAASARRLLTGLANAKSEHQSSTAAAETTAVARIAPTLPVIPPLPAPARWIPPDVDTGVPPVESGAACHLDEILPKAQKNVVKFTHALDRFTATEKFEDQLISRQGIPVANTALSFDYLVSMHQVRPGILNVDEYRNGSLSLRVFPHGIATLGLPAVILIFHPAQADEFEMECEGLGYWRGMPAWQIHFRQKANRKAMLRTYRLNGALYPVPLKGRAWISRDLLQVVRIETDLVRPMPEIKLLGEHQEIDYGPIAFKSRNTELWLPASTDFYTEFRGKRVHRRLTYTNYLLFSVDDARKVSAPPQPKGPA